MRLVLLGLVLLLTGCKKSGPPASGIELVYAGSSLDATTAAIVEKRLAAMKIAGGARFEEGKVKVRVDGADVEKVKGTLHTVGSLEFFGVDDITSKKLCSAPHADSVSVEKEDLTDGSFTCFFTGPKASVKDSAQATLGAQLRLQKLEDGRVRSYAVFLPALMNGTSVTEAIPVPRSDNNPYPAVKIRFDEAGKAAFATNTANLTDMRMAIVLDDLVLSAPVVRERITGGTAMITMGLKDESASLSAALQSGRLPELTLETEHSY